MTETTKLRPGRPRVHAPRLATAARAGAAVGAVICVVLILATWLGRGALVGAIDDLAATVDSGFSRAQAAAGQVTDRIDAAAATAGAVAASAGELATNPAPPPAEMSALSEKVGRLADAYRTVRTRYADVRENVTNAVTAVQRVTRFVPGVQAPEGAGDRIQAIDTKLQSIDDTITGIFPSLETAGPTGTVASSVAQGASRAQSALTDASASVAALAASIDQLDARATNATDTLRTVVTIGAVLLTLVLLWVLLLNVALWQLGRRMVRQTGTAVESPQPQPELPPAT